MKRRKIIKAINIVLILIFVWSAFNVGKIYYDYKNADDTYQQMQDEYIAVNTEPSLPEQPAPEQSEAVKEPEPPITVDFDALLNKNKDVIGWLYCPDTVINYPVVQGKDNNQYLRRGLDGKYLVSGTLFADYRNGALHEDANYIIYGHNMKNGTMFHSLANYKDPSYYKQHPILYYLTPDGNYKIELFAGLVIKRNDKIYLPNQSREDVFELLTQYRASSTFQSDAELAYEDTFITLSTCSYEFDDARYVVIGKLTKIPT